MLANLLTLNFETVHNTFCMSYEAQFNIYYSKKSGADQDFNKHSQSPL